MAKCTRHVLLAATAALLIAGLSGSAAAMILVHIPGMKGNSQVPGYEDWFVADSFSFGVEREMKESGEKGGTADINIGVGELQECTISKSMDAASAMLAQFAINGNSPGTAEIHFVEIAGGKPRAYLQYKLDRVFVKSWSTSGDADDRPTEEVSFYYNKIAFTYAPTHATEVSGGWDRTKNAVWSGEGSVQISPKRFQLKQMQRE